MTDQREQQPQANPQPVLKQNDRYILGAVLLAAVVHYHMSVMAHVQQISACNALHDLTSRVSRILLLSADRCDEDIQLSQESLAEMLGVRRSSVTTAAAILRGAGAIEYRRAVIKILDREKLRSTRSRPNKLRAPEFRVVD